MLRRIAVKYAPLGLAVVSLAVSHHAHAQGAPVAPQPPPQPQPQAPQPQYPQPPQAQPGYPPQAQQPYAPQPQYPQPPQAQQPYAPQPQYPQPPQAQQPYPPQPQYPQPPQAQQPYPPQPQYPQPAQAQPGYPQQPQYPQPAQAQPGYPQPQYPQQQPPPAGYPLPPQGYPPQPGAMPPPGYPPQPVSPPVASGTRDPSEMAVLYGTSVAYGIGTGIWVDGLAHASDPGIAFIAPLAFGAAMPIGVYLWDNYQPLHHGVPASISTGLALGAVEGIAISGTQWQHSDANGHWKFAGQSSLTWVLATGGGVGGYAFGEWLRPDPRTLAFIGSGAGWGAISGSFLGAAVGSGDWKNGSSVGGLVGYNLGIVGSGAISLAGWVPSWRTQQAMWLGYLIGTAAASVVYLFYIGSSDDPRHGMIANALGGLAGVGVAAALTANMKDSDQSASWLAPFQVGIAPTQYCGAALSAYGMF